MLLLQSNDPVIIKKIYLKTWCLRDEIVSVIQRKMDDGGQRDSLNIGRISQEFVKDSHPLHAVKKNEKYDIIQRNSANISQDNVFLGMCMLSEINMDEMRFFNSSHFMEGQSIVIEFQIPKKFTVNAEIISSKPYNRGNRIISNKKFFYRIRASFTFLRPGERTLLRNFITSITPEIENGDKSNDRNEDELDNAL